RLQALSSEDLVAYYRRRYAPERMFFVVGGSVEPEAVFQALEEYVGSWNNGELLELPLPETPANLNGRNLESIFEDEVARLYCGVKICDCADDDYFALALLSGIMGQNRSSILTKKLKREQELALDISAQLSNLPGLEMLEICAVCEPDKVLALEEALRNTCREIIDNPPTELMLTKEKQRLIFNYTHDLAGVDNMISNAAGGVIFNGNPNFTAEFLRKLIKVDTEAVWRAAARYLRPELLSISRVVPRAIGEESGTSGGQEMRSEKLSGGKCAKFYISDPELPFVDIAMILPGGVYFEGDGSWGGTQLLRRLWCSGYSELDEEMVADYLDEHCLEFNSGCSSSHLTLTLNAPREKISEVKNFLRGILGNLQISATAFER
ncbi:MAG: insulinase family protein, partial [Victivallaceae bacterium]